MALGLDDKFARLRDGIVRPKLGETRAACYLGCRYDEIRGSPASFAPRSGLTRVTILSTDVVRVMASTCWTPVLGAMFMEGTGRACNASDPDC